jgi:chemotaxis protein MotA
MIIGVVGGLGLITWAILIAGNISSFVNLPSIFVTMGGTAAAIFINFSIKDVLSALVLVRYLLRGRVLPNASEIITLLVNLAVRARKEGLLALEDEAGSINNEFMKKGLQLVVDGDDPEVVRTMLGNEIIFTQERHRIGAKLFKQASFYSPAFGMIGTLIGMIIMLGQLDRPESLGPSLALAMITTFYGAIMAYLLFMPIAGKLEERSREEIRMKRLIMEGILSIQAGDNPRTVEDKLNVFLSPRDRKTIYNPTTK